MGSLVVELREGQIDIDPTCIISEFFRHRPWLQSCIRNGKCNVMFLPYLSQHGSHGDGVCEADGY